MSFVEGPLGVSFHCILNNTPSKTFHLSECILVPSYLGSAPWLREFFPQEGGLKRVEED